MGFPHSLACFGGRLHRVCRGFLPSRRGVLIVLILVNAWQVLLAESFEVVVSEKVLAGAAQKYGAGAPHRLKAWVRLVEETRNKTERQKIKAVNDFFNKVPYKSDLEHWGVRDYWATPVEVLASNGADCEDFAIAKYFTLVALNVSVDKLKITYVKATRGNPINQSHMVLTYYPSPAAEPLVLDNLINEIRPASQRSDLIPVYAFNGEGLWLTKTRRLGKVSGTSANIRPWQELRSRIGKEF